MSAESGRTACFFARVSDPRQVESIEFYSQDVRFLEDLGYRVRIVTRVRDLPAQPASDLYFCWWWTWAFAPVFFARRNRRPAIITGTFNHHLFPGRPWRQRALIAWAARRAGANVFVSQLECDLVPALIPGLARPSYSPHTVDTAAYAPPAGGPAGRDPGLLLSIAHLDDGNSQRKCVASSIRAFARVAGTHPGARLVIAGERGSAYPGLARLAADAGVGSRVEFPGHVSRAEKISLLQRCAVYLQPSRFEGFGLAGLEAMACGAPVITSPVGAVREVCGEAAVYINGDDVEALGGAMDALLAAPGQRQALGAAGRARAEATFPLARRRRELEAVLRTAGAL